MKNLAIFMAALAAAGYAFDKAKPKTKAVLTAGALLSMYGIGKLVEKANKEADERYMNEVDDDPRYW